MSAQVPLDRLAPQDFYRLLEWLRDEWADGSEDKIAKQLARLRRHFEHLPTRYWRRAEPQLRELGRARLVRNVDLHPLFRALAEIVAAWDRSRPPLLSCPECWIELRGHGQLANHRLAVHNVEED